MKIKLFIIILYKKCRNYINFLFFLLKFLNILKILVNFFDLSIISDLDDNKNNVESTKEESTDSTNKQENKRPDIYSQFFEKRNLIKIGLKISEPFRQLFYIWLSLKLSESMLGQPEAKSIIGILIIIEVIDKSIAEIIDENIEKSIEDELNNTDKNNNINEQKENIEKKLDVNDTGNVNDIEKK